MSDDQLARIGPPHMPAWRCGEVAVVEAVDQPRIVTGEFAAVWLLRGSTEHVDGQGKRHRLMPGEGFHRFPERIHAVRFAPRTQFLYLAMPAEGLLLLRGLGISAVDAPVIHPGLHAHLARRWRALVRSMQGARPRQLASLAVRVLELAVDLHVRSDVRGDDRMAALMERAAARLGDPSAAQLRQPALAHEVGLSYRTFRRAFAAFAGMSPEAYRIRCRIDAAQELLRTSSLPIADIAERLGYRDGADFARQFTRMTGRSPSACRRADPWSC